MNRVFAVILVSVLVMVSILVPVGGQSPVLGWGRVCRARTLRVRSGPGLHMDVRRALPGGTKISLWEKREGWYRIDGPTSEMWVWGEYVCPELPGAQDASGQQLEQGTRVYFSSNQAGEFNPCPGYQNCCDWDVPITVETGTTGWISGGPRCGRWRVTWNVSCRRYLFVTYCTRQSRWFLPTQFVGPQQTNERTQ